MPTIEENIQRFEELLGSVQRPGMDKLMNYIKKKGSSGIGVEA